MFKWLCLGVAVVFLSAVVWILDDMRREVRSSTQLLSQTGETVNEHLPVIVERSRQTTETVNENLPTIVEKTRVTTETLAELAADIRQLKELVGVTGGARETNLVAYANGVLRAIEESGGTIGLRKTLGGKGLKSTLPAREWAAGARKEALYLAVVSRSKAELVTRLCRNLFGSDWYIQVGKGEPVKLLDWLRANHAPTRELKMPGDAVKRTPRG
jgi:hypothetical protein